MREQILKAIYRLEAETGIIEPEDLRTWSNVELMVYYGDLRIEEYHQWEQANAKRRTDEPT